MPVRPAALVIAPEAPYPLVGGGPLRSASLIAYLSQHYDVDLVVFREPGAGNPLDAIPNGLIRDGHVVNLRFHEKTLFARALRNVSRAVRGAPPLNDRFAGYDLALKGSRYALGMIEHFWCAPYVDVLAAHCETVWLDLHNIESVLYRSAARGVMKPLMRRFASSALELERTLLPRFNGVLVTSEADAERIGGMTRAAVYPNAIPFVPAPTCTKRREIVFSGNLEYDPNRCAVRYFCQEIWPIVRDVVPDVRLRIMGRNAHAVARMLDGDSRIELSGHVTDAVGEIAAAQVSIAPLLSGSGTRVKIIEAWAAGTPVVSTSIGAEGLPGRSGEHLLISDGPSNFAAAVVQVLESEALAHALAAAGRALYEHHLTWESAWAALSRVGL